MAALWLLLTVTPSRAATHYVNASSVNPVPPYLTWDTAAVNIQDAIDIAVIGDEIVVTNGLYATGGRLAGSLTNRVVVDKPVWVRSVNGAQFTIIQGFHGPSASDFSDAVRCVYLTNGSSLSGFTLTNGAAGGEGGGLWCQSYDAVTVSNCVVVGNFAQGSGGGVSGGTLYNCTISHNAATNSSAGGGAYDCTLFNCAISENCANSGGGVYFATLNNCTLSGNWAVDQGGGVTECSLTNCLLIGNSVSNYGGAAWGGWLVNCTVVGNSAATGGGGAGTDSFMDHDGCKLLNSIVYYNSALLGTNCSECTQYDCCMPNQQSDTQFGGNNITNEPLFVDLASTNLRLQSNSPCINAGDNSYVAGGTDLDGRPRIVGGTVDIGAYEFQPGISGAFIGWLESYGLATDGSADYADADGDGMNNWQEWRTGTDPTNALSALRLLSPARDGTNITVKWESVAGIAYFLERSSNLTSGTIFTPLATNLPGQAGTTSYTDTNATATSRLFYRVGVGH